ncbi:MAG: hypothetical protein OXG43_09425 [Chloroflexi bacterium]|nr:hypothetical protein [Chloroflexota bacterium]
MTATDPSGGGSAPRPTSGDAEPPNVPGTIERLADMGPIASEAKGSTAASPDLDRPLTLAETWSDFAGWLQSTRWQRPIAAIALLVAGALAWAVISAVVPWPEGIPGTVQRVLAMDVGWAPLPIPDDPRLGADLSLMTAAWVGAPLVLSAFWFAAAYHLDRESRRAFGVSRIPGVRHSTGYTAMAVLLVFPLMVLGLASGAWGVFMLGTWAIAFGAWGPAGFLVALLAIFGLVVRLANAALDRRAGAS